MYQLMDSHALTVIVVIAGIMAVPYYILATYVFSGASGIKGVQIGVGFLIFGSLMVWVCLSDLRGRLGLIGNIIIPMAWLLPSLILYIWRDWFLSERLSQKWLIGLQTFRLVGGVFLIEMALGNIPGIFAYPAGIGDMLVGLVALIVLLTFRSREYITKLVIFTVICLGALDFLSAFFFGFFSSETPVQLFFPEVKNIVGIFPIGMIPLFLVPYAIFFHTLSALNYAKFDRRKLKIQTSY